MDDKKLHRDSSVRIKIIGIGGAGNNLINRMVLSCGKNISFVSVDTDVETIRMSMAMEKIALPSIASETGHKPMPEIGQMGARKKTEDIVDCLDKQDIVVIIAGMGGSCGTGASSEIAKIAQDLCVQVIAIVTRPFCLEGTNRAGIAEKGIATLSECVDGIIVIPNENLKNGLQTGCTFSDVFSVVDDIVKQTVHDLIASLESRQDKKAAFAKAVANIQHKDHLMIRTASTTIREKSEY